MVRLMATLEAMTCASVGAAGAIGELADLVAGNEVEVVNGFGEHLEGLAGDGGQDAL